MYKIEIVNNYCDDKFNQLEMLIRKFAITVFMMQKYNLLNESKEKMNQYISDYNRFLSEHEIQFLEKDINNRIKFAKDSIKLKNKRKKTRYYILTKDNVIIAFQTAQVRHENNKIEGWRNFGYTEDLYKGRTGTVVDTYGRIYNGILSNVLYQNISKWFDEEKVETERTATGKNMYKNIKVYIVNKGFVPEKEDEERIYLIKDYNNIKNKLELKHIYEKYINKYKN